MFQKKSVEKIRTHFMFSDFSSPENLTVLEKMWKNIVKRDRPQITIWFMSIACWIPTNTNTHSEYVILTALPPQQWLLERASMLRCTSIVFVFTYSVPALSVLKWRGTPGYGPAALSGFSSPVSLHSATTAERSSLFLEARPFAYRSCLFPLLHYTATACLGFRGLL